MLRFRKFWIWIAAIIMVIMLVASIFRPELVTVVPNQRQLDQKPDLRIHNEKSKSDTPQKEHLTPADSLNKNLK
jgi:hypothetical protein